MQIWSKPRAEEYLFHPSFAAGVVTIGNFDGLHLGHQSLFRAAEKRGSPRIVMTFDPHPMQVLHPERHLRRIFPREDLVEQLPRFGVDLLVILPFDKKFAETPALEFLNTFVGDLFRPRHVVAGYDFAFGTGRTGTLDILRQWAAGRGVEVDVVAPLRLGPEIVSSRRIRDLIVKGDVYSAGLLLDRPFYLRGQVVEGAGRGAQIGIPTLNLRAVNETIPPSGVYATRTYCEGEGYSSVTNIGVNPTFGSQTQIKIETHILDGVHHWREKNIDVHFIERLREERKFAGVEELKKQIHSDIQKARAILEKTTP